VFMGSIAMILWEVPFLDPLLSILISIFILINAVKSLRQSFTIFLQGTPAALDTTHVCDLVLSVEGIDEVHDCHVWSMDGEFNILTIHLICNKNIDLLEQNRIKGMVKEKLSSLPIDHFTFEFELREKLQLEDFVH
ncbi:MAG: cation transporter, partial [Cyclobacteriaceae bacterium]|nr:cation transporter [Cyclobacteriaceae bacterium]